MMKNSVLARRYFPLDIATGLAFVGRRDEIEELQGLIGAGQHAWIQGPRRWGKSSLIRQAIHGMDVVSVRCDLLGCTDIGNACDLLLNRIADAAGRLTGGDSGAIKEIQKAFSELEVSFKVLDTGIKLKFEREPDALPQFLSLALEGLDRLAVARKQRVVLVIDEFQALCELDNGEAVEGWIRSGIQHAKATMAIFSGSNRTLLAAMFTSRKRPLYRMCRQVEIGPVEPGEYAEHMREAFTQRWGGSVDEDVIEAVLGRTDCHPYVTNLCGQVLMDLDNPPTIDDFDQAWAKVVRQDRSYQAAYINRLTTTEKKVLRAIALEPTTKPRSQAYLAKYGVASSTMGVTLERLEQQDLVCRNDDDQGDAFGRYEIVDPILRAVAGRG